jgi:hypothetical protein
MSKYIIRAGMPMSPVTSQSSQWGWTRTLEAARKRSVSLSRRVRTDIEVGIELDGVIIEKTGTVHEGMVGNSRELRPCGYHPVYRDGVLLGFAPDGDNYDISRIVLAPEGVRS